MCAFVIGGMTGVMHNSLFPATHWLMVSQAFGFVLDERLGKASFWCWLVRL